MQAKTGLYRKFLEEKMKKEIEKIIDSSDEKCNFYYNFVDNELIGVVDSFNHTYLIVLNSHKDTTVKLEQDNFEYKLIRKKTLKSNISKYTYSKLVKRGLYQSEYSGKNSNNGYFGVHRLKACIKENILGKEVDHIDENPYNNDISNLNPLLKEEHNVKTNKNRRKRRLNEKYISL